jgi:hypothetical protein
MFKYGVDLTEVRNAYEVAYGDAGAHVLLGKLFTMVSEDVQEKLYAEALQDVRRDLEQRGLI